MMKTEDDFSRTPFSFLLFQLWQSCSTGILRVEKDRDKRIFQIQDGDITQTASRMERELLYDHLKKNEGFDHSLLNPAGEKPGQKSSPVKSLIEGGVAKPDRLWSALETFLLDRILAVFGWDRGHYFFDRGATASAPDVLFRLSSLEVILQGVRQMENTEIVQSWLPPANETYRALRPEHAGRVCLRPEERYVYGMLQKPVELGLLLTESELGKRETQKIFFLLMNLGFAGKVQPSSLKKKKDKEKPLDLRKHFSDLNEKCSYIFKYMSKEIGPVARSVLEKGLDDIRESLSSSMRDIRLDEEGCFDEKELWDKASREGHRHTREDILRDMNEILAAEILAIKSTLGDEHETQLVQNLKKM